MTIPSGDYLALVVAVFGTTISPYLFFWQAGEEVEDEKEDPKAKPLINAPLQAPRQLARIQLDTLVGMGISNIITLSHHDHDGSDPERSWRDGHPDLFPGSGSIAPYCGTFCFYGFCLGHRRHRHACVAGPRGQRRIRTVRSAFVAKAGQARNKTSKRNSAYRSARPTTQTGPIRSMKRATASSPLNG